MWPESRGRASAMVGSQRTSTAPSWTTSEIFYALAHQPLSCLATSPLIEQRR